MDPVLLDLVSEKPLLVAGLPAGVGLVAVALSIGAWRAEPGTRGLLAAAAGRIAASEVEGGETGYSVARLLAALRERGEQRAITVAIEHAVPFGTVSRIVYTVGQAGHVEVRFAVRDGSEIALSSITLPSLNDPRLRTATPPSVSVGADGVRISRGALRYDTACEGRSTPVTTVERGSTELDLLAVTRCLSRLRAHFPSDAGTIIVSADPDIPFGEVARVIATGRGARGLPLYPDVLLSAGVR